MKPCATGSMVLIALLAGCVEAPESTSDGPGSAPDLIHAFLLDGGHRAWPGQSTVRATSDFGGTRVWLNPVLARSVMAGSALHPPGAAAVREIYAEDLTTLVGFSYMARTQAQAGPEAWFWFESYSFEPGARPQIAQTAAPTCVGCHADAVDFIQTPFPLP